MCIRDRVQPAEQDGEQDAGVPAGAAPAEGDGELRRCRHRPLPGTVWYSRPPSKGSAGQSRAYPGGRDPAGTRTATGIRRAVPAMACSVLLALCPLVAAEAQPV